MPGPPPILCFAGRSGAGKTTLLVEVIRCLRERGWRVATAKHDPHGHASLDTEGKDTWRHRAAGARTVVLVGPREMACVSDVDEEPSLEAVRDRFAAGADILLAEGWKRAPHPKIEMARKALDAGLLLRGDPHVVAVAADFEVDAGVPRLDLNDPNAVADFIEARFLRGPNAP
jgi:molybdopterin-guanine dinucleotide biosynthesis protein B